MALVAGVLDSRQLMWLALAAYFTYVINAAQFIWKLRMARLEAPTMRVADAADAVAA